MWPRVVEVMLGCWMLATPFVFRGTPQVDAYSANAIASGLIVIVSSLTAFWHPARHARLVTLLVSFWLAGHGYFSAERPGPPVAQNELAVGLTLLLFAILPNENNKVPEPWQRRPGAPESGAAGRGPEPT